MMREPLVESGGVNCEKAGSEISESTTVRTKISLNKQILTEGI
jgi:hypothetical protein